MPMAYFKRRQLSTNKKWYPEAVLIGKPVTTREIAQKIAALSSLSEGDVLSVLHLLAPVMGDSMNSGRSVKLDGMGTYYYTINAQGSGVDTKEEVSVKQIKGTRVRFLPEVFRTSGGNVATRSLVSDKVFWQELKLEDTDSTTEGGEEEGGGESPDPIV